MKMSAPLIVDTKKQSVWK